jgi:hypothetical protein
VDQSPEESTIVQIALYQCAPAGTEEMAIGVIYGANAAVQVANANVTECTVLEWGLVHVEQLSQRLVTRVGSSNFAGGSPGDNAFQLEGVGTIVFTSSNFFDLAIEEGVLSVASSDAVANVTDCVFREIPDAAYFSNNAVGLFNLRGNRFAEEWSAPLVRIGVNVDNSVGGQFGTLNLGFNVPQCPPKPPTASAPIYRSATPVATPTPRATETAEAPPQTPVPCPGAGFIADQLFSGLTAAVPGDVAATCIQVVRSGFFNCHSLIGLSGGAVFANGTGLSIYIGTSAFSGCTCTTGGALYLGGVSVDVLFCCGAECEAMDYGGFLALEIATSPNVVHTSIYQSSSSVGNVASGLQGRRAVTPFLGQCNWTSCTAARDGVAFQGRFDGAGVSTIKHATMVGGTGWSFVSNAASGRLEVRNSNLCDLPAIYGYCSVYYRTASSGIIACYSSVFRFTTSANVVEGYSNGYSFYNCVFGNPLQAGAYYVETSGNVVTSAPVTLPLTHNGVLCPPADPATATRALYPTGTVKESPTPVPTLSACAVNAYVDERFLGTTPIGNGTQELCVVVSVCVFEYCQNLASGRSGGAISVVVAENCQIVATSFSGCEANGNGGAVYAAGGGLIVSRSCGDRCKARVGGLIGQSTSASSFEQLGALNCSATLGGGVMSVDELNEFTAGNFTYGGSGSNDGSGFLFLGSLGALVRRVTIQQVSAYSYSCVGHRGTSQIQFVDSNFVPVANIAFGILTGWQGGAGMRMQLTNCRFRCGSINLIEGNMPGTYSFIGCVLDRAFPGDAAYAVTSDNVVTSSVATLPIAYQHAQCPAPTPARSRSISPVASATLMPTPTVCAWAQTEEVTDARRIGMPWTSTLGQPCVLVSDCLFEQCVRSGGAEVAGGAISVAISQTAEIRDTAFDRCGCFAGFDQGGAVYASALSVLFEGCCARDCTAFYGQVVAAEADVKVRGLTIHESAPIVFVPGTHHYEGCLWVGTGRAIDADGLNVTDSAIEESGLVAFIADSLGSPSRFFYLNARGLEVGWDVICVYGRSPVTIEASNFVLIEQDGGIIYVAEPGFAVFVTETVFIQCGGNHWFDIESGGNFIVNTAYFDGPRPSSSQPDQYQFWFEHVAEFGCMFSQQNLYTADVSFKHVTCLVTALPGTATATRTALATASSVAETPDPRVPSRSPVATVTAIATATPSPSPDLRVPSRTPVATFPDATPWPTASYVLNWDLVAASTVPLDGKVELVSQLFTEARSFVVPDGVLDKVVLAGPGGSEVTFSNLKLHGTSSVTALVEANAVVLGQFEVEGSLEVHNVQLGPAADLYLVQDAVTGQFPTFSASRQASKPRVGSVHVEMSTSVDVEQRLVTEFSPAASCADWLAAVGEGTTFLRGRFALQCQADALTLFDTTPSGGKKSNTPLVILGVVVGVVLVVVVIVVIVIVRKAKPVEGMYGGILDGGPGGDNANAEEAEGDGVENVEAFED